MEDRIEWSGWHCERHDTWFSAKWITEDSVDCIRENCNVGVFTGPDQMDGGFVRSLLFDDAYKWVRDWEEPRRWGGEA